MIRFLIYSFCLFGLISCKSYQPTLGFIDKEQTVENLYFADLSQEYSYSITISAYKHTVSGILVIKAINDSTHRILMATEFGNTLLDLTITPFGYTKNYAMPDLDRKIVLNLLSHDFFVLLNKSWQTQSFYQNQSVSIYKAKRNTKNYFLTYNSGLLSQIDYAKRKKKVTINFDGTTQNKAQFIKLKHFNLDIEIEMKHL